MYRQEVRLEIVSVTTDLGATTGVARSLGRRTVVTGPNRTGKNRFINSIALSLTGGIDDYIGRGTAGASGKPVRTTTEIARYIGPGRDGLAASVTFDSGETASYALTKNRAGEVSRSSELPGVLRDRAGDPAWTLMPVREVHAKLAAGPDKAREFFLPHIVPAETLAASLATALTDVDRKRLIERGLTPPTTFDGVASLIGSATTNAADCASGADNALRTADQLAAITNQPNEAVIATAEAVAAAARDIYNQKLQAGFRMTAAPENLEAEIAALTAQAAGIAARWGGYTPGAYPPAPTIPPLEIAIGPTPPNIQAAQSWITGYGEPVAAVAALSTNGCCAACGNAVNGQALVQHWTSQVAVAKAELARISQEYQGKIAWYHNEVTRVTQEHTAACQVVQDRDTAYQVDLGIYQNIQSQIQAKQAARATLALSSPEDMDPTPLAEYEARAHAADQALAGIREAAATWASITASRERAALLSSTAAWWTDLRSRLKLWAEQLIQASLDDFTTRVARYLPESWGKLTIALENDTGSRTFRIGFNRDGHEVIPLCGGEWSAVVLAISATILDRIRPPYAILTLASDVGWHPNTLAEVMYALRECPWQVVIASCIVPPAVDGWTVLALDGNAESTTVGTPAFVPPQDPPKRRPRKPRASSGGGDGDTVGEGSEAPPGSGAAQAFQEPHDRLVAARAQKQGLLALGWDDRQINKMTVASLEMALNGSYTPQTHSVLADGSLFAVNPPTLDAFRTPRS